MIDFFDKIKDITEDIIILFLMLLVWVGISFLVFAQKFKNI